MTAADVPLETPARDLDRTIAHLLMTAMTNDGHLVVHTAGAVAAEDSPEPGLLAHHLHHATGHVRAVSSHLVKLRDAVTRRLPAVGRQLADLDRAVPGNRSAGRWSPETTRAAERWVRDLGLAIRSADADDHVPRGALDMSIAHDLASTQVAAAHVDRHLSEAAAADAAGDPASVTFNIDHAVNHVAEITHGLGELDNDLPRRIPAVRPEMDLLHRIAQDGPGPPARSHRAALSDDLFDWCDRCGSDLGGGGPCVECGNDPRQVSERDRARDELVAKFADGSRWERRPG